MAKKNYIIDKESKYAKPDRVDMANFEMPDQSIVLGQPKVPVEYFFKHLVITEYYDGRAMYQAKFLGLESPLYPGQLDALAWAIDALADKLLNEEGGDDIPE